VTPGSGAEKAGLKSGDRLLEIEGRDARDQVTLYEEILYAPGVTKSLLVERDGARKSVQLTIGMDDKYHLGVPGFTFQDRPVILSVEEGGPAEQAGIQTGDTIVQIEDREAPSAAEIQAIVRSKEGSPVHLQVERGGTRVPIDVTPRKHDKAVLIGVRFAPGPVRKVGLGGAAAEGARYCGRTATLLFITIKQLVKGQISPRAMSGPLELAQVSGDRWREGPAAFIELLAFVSMQLGIMNLLPIPGLDGGHMLILLVEGAIRRALPDRIKQWVITSGFALLLLFAGVVIWFDIIKTGS
jgi:regulator of sigma E protease